MRRFSIPSKSPSEGSDEKSDGTWGDGRGAAAVAGAAANAAPVAQRASNRLINIPARPIVPKLVSHAGPQMGPRSNRTNPDGVE